MNRYLHLVIHTIVRFGHDSALQSKIKINMKKRNLVPLSKLPQLRGINVRKIPKATQLNWASTISKGLTMEAKDVAQSTSTTLAPHKEASKCTLHPNSHPLHLQPL